MPDADSIKVWGMGICRWKNLFIIKRNPIDHGKVWFGSLKRNWPVDNHWISKWSSEVSSQNRTHKNPFENPLHGCIVRGGEMEELQTQNDQSSKVWKLSFNQTAPWASGDGFGPARDCSHGGSSGGVEQELLGLDPGNPDVHRCRPRPVHLLRLGGEGGRIQRATRGPPFMSKD